MLPSQAWAQALAGIYIFSNGSPIKDLGDDDSTINEKLPTYVFYKLMPALAKLL